VRRQLPQGKKNMSHQEHALDTYRSLVNAWITAFNSHDVGVIVSLYAADAELFDAGMKYRRRGKQEIERWFTRRFQSMPTLTYTPDWRIFEAGDDADVAAARAAVTWIARGRSPRLLGQAWLARPFQVEGVSVFTLAHGLIQAQRGYYDHLATLEQILPFLKWVLPARL
jgi:ketosteroid isomerase-like protein